MVMVAVEITTEAKVVVQSAVGKIGFDSYGDDLSSVDSKGLCDKTCEVLVSINKQSPDIAGGVHLGKENLNVGDGERGNMRSCKPSTGSCKLSVPALQKGASHAEFWFV